MVESKTQPSTIRKHKFTFKSINFEFSSKRKIKTADLAALQNKTIQTLWVVRKSAYIIALEMMTAAINDECQIYPTDCQKLANIDSYDPHWDQKQNRKMI